MAGQLRRGVMHYADGGMVPDMSGVVLKQPLPPALVPPPQGPAAIPQLTPEQAQQLPLLRSQQPSAPVMQIAPPVAQDPGTSPWGGGGPVFSSEPAVRVPQGSRTVPQGAPPSPDVLGAGSTGYSQLMSGQYGAALQNPHASQATKTAADLMNTLGGFGDYLQRAYRAQAVASPPSAVDRVVDFFSGDDSTKAELDKHAVAATQLQNPLTQQYMMTNPDAMAEAENDRIAFGAKSQTPEFQQIMQDYVKNHATASQPIAVGDGAGNTRPVQVGEPAKAAKVMSDHGVPADAAAALTHGHQLSREEFINSLINTPTKVIQMLFGAQLGHVPTVHDAVAKTYFDAMGQSLAKEEAAIAEMEQRGDRREAAEIKKRKAALAENRQLYSTQMGAYVGGYQRQYPMGLPPP